VTTTAETPPKRGTRADATMTKLGVGLVVILGFVALVAAVLQGGSSTAPLLLAASAPMRVTVPSISTSSTLIPLGQEGDGSLAVPPLSTPMQASWYDKSPAPGAIGPAVILGHVNGGGKPGVFLKLKETKAGDQILVDRADGQTAVFTVAHVDTVLKDQFPAQEVYGDTPNAQLRLITCGGDLDRRARSYRSNVVVYADLTSVHRT